jgi:hypothetical protein
MIGLLQWLAGAVALGAAGHRAWLWRGCRPRTGAASLIGFAVTVGLSQSLQSMAGAGLGGRGVLLLSTELKVAACCFLLLMAYALGPPERRSARVRGQLVRTALVMVAIAALYGAAEVTPVRAELTVPERGRLALAGFDLLFTAYCGWSVGAFTLVVARAARGVGPGPLRTGLRMVVVSGVLGLVWVASELVPMVVGLRTGCQHGAEDAFSAPVSVLAIGLGLGGASLAALDGSAAGPVRWQRARRGLRRIDPLWSALHRVRPEIALDPPSGGLRLRGKTEFALYRRVIEIRDGQLWLRAHLHPQVPDWVAQACGNETGERRRAATVEAAVLAAALEAAAVGHRYPCAVAEGYLPPPLTDLDTEAAWLVLVAEQFTGSRVVAEVRARVRAELTAVPEPGPAP